MIDGMVTVYIPTRGNSPLLGRALNSVMAQTYKNIEIILVVDGEKCDMGQHLRGLDRSKVKCLFLGEPKGANVARNLAIKESSGQYITGLDDDDYFLPNRVEVLLDGYHPKLAFVCSDEFLEVDSGKRLLKKYKKGKILLDDILKENCATNQVLTETYKFKDVGFFDPDMPACQDYDMWIRLILRYGIAFRVPVPTIVVDKSLSRARISNNPKKLDGFKMFFQKYQGYMRPIHKRIHSMRMLLAEKDKISFLEFLRCTTRFTWIRDLKRVFKGKEWL